MSTCRSTTIKTNKVGTARIMSKQITTSHQNLFNEIKQIIEEARNAVGRTVNVGITIMNWNVGRRINEEVLKSKRAEYGKATIATMSRLLTNEYGKGYSKSALTRMCKFQQQFEDQLNCCDTVATIELVALCGNNNTQN